MSRGRHRGPGYRRRTVAGLRSDLEWSEADRARLADDNRELRRQLAALQGETGSEEDTIPVRIPVVAPDGRRSVALVRRIPRWALADQ